MSQDQVLWKIKNKFINLNEIPSEFITNKEIIIAALKNNGLAIGHVPLETRNDVQIATTAVRQNGMAIEYISEELRNTFSIVLEAVRQNGNALEYASDNLKNNEEIVTTAVENNGISLGFASNHLKTNKEIIKKAIDVNAMVFGCLRMETLDDIEIMSHIVKKNYILIKYNMRMFDEIYGDKECVKCILRQNPYEYRFISEHLKKDPDIITTLLLSIKSSNIENEKEFINLLPPFYINFINKFQKGDPIWSYFSGLLFHKYRLQNKFHPDNQFFKKVLSSDEFFKL